jgi:hypothetical protein
VTAANLAIETFLPADAESAVRLRELAELPELPELLEHAPGAGLSCRLASCRRLTSSPASPLLS